MNTTRADPSPQRSNFAARYTACPVMSYPRPVPAMALCPVRSATVEEAQRKRAA
jgi:hypothetical protein